MGTRATLAAVVAAVLLALTATSMASAASSRRCATVLAEMKGSNGNVIYVGRKVRAYGGTTCRKARAVVKHYLGGRSQGGVGEYRKVDGYLCKLTGLSVAEGGDGNIIGTCNNVRDGKRYIVFAFDLIGGN